MKFEDCLQVISRLLISPAKATAKCQYSWLKLPSIGVENSACAFRVILLKSNEDQIR